MSLNSCTKALPMDSVLNELDAQYDAAQRAGRQHIRNRWSALSNATRAALQSSGFYSERGDRLDAERTFAGGPADDCERLEYAIGVLKQCAAATLPQRSVKGAPIPSEALTKEVLSSCEEILTVPAWHDPGFLRIALAAVAVHKQADALTMIGPASSPSAALGCVGAVFKAALFLAMPAALAVGLAASARQDVGGAVLAFYLVGFGVLAILSTAGIGVKKKDGFELAYDRWTRFQSDGAAGVTGAGALEHLRRMAQDGVTVPSIAFDVAETLRQRMVGGCLRSP